MVRKINFKVIAAFIFLTPLAGFAQDDLMNILDQEVKPEAQEVEYTFKSTRIINSQSIERMHEGQLDVRINHRFGQLNLGPYELYGMDQAVMNFCLEYGVKDWLQIGIRRGNVDKLYDGSVKFSLFRQTKGGPHPMPVAISFFSDLSLVTLKDSAKYINTLDRFAYTNQLLIARKFTEKISLQLMPTFVHRNQVAFDEQNDILACGIGGRYKMTRRLALSIEYFAVNNKKNTSTKYFNPVSVGFDLETGGHVFQLFLTNSLNMVEDRVIAQTQGDINKGGIYFGFNISRVFGGGKVKETKE